MATPAQNTKKKTSFTKFIQNFNRKFPSFINHPSQNNKKQSSNQNNHKKQHHNQQTSASAQASSSKPQIRQTSMKQQQKYPQQRTKQQSSKQQQKKLPTPQNPPFTQQIAKQQLSKQQQKYPQQRAKQQQKKHLTHQNNPSTQARAKQQPSKQQQKKPPTQQQKKIFRLDYPFNNEVLLKNMPKIDDTDMARLNVLFNEVRINSYLQVVFVDFKFQTESLRDEATKYLRDHGPKKLCEKIIEDNNFENDGYTLILCIGNQSYCFEIHEDDIVEKDYSMKLFLELIIYNFGLRDQGLDQLVAKQQKRRNESYF
jgi:hypothetical protein